MPAAIHLEDFGALINDAFGDHPYHVGSSIAGSKTWRDVDVRLIVSDEEYAAMGLGDPEHPHENPKWVALVLAFTTLGRQMTGLPIDFQIQQQTHANAKFDAPRSALGLRTHFRRQPTPSDSPPPSVQSHREALARTIGVPNTGQSRPDGEPFTTEGNREAKES
jgi:hypothetical protein